MFWNFNQAPIFVNLDQLQLYFNLFIYTSFPSVCNLQLYSKTFYTFVKQVSSIFKKIFVKKNSSLLYSLLKTKGSGIIKQVKQDIAMSKIFTKFVFLLCHAGFNNWCTFRKYIHLISLPYT